MKTTRLEAFTDGVVAIIITITVLEMKVPEAASFTALRAEWPVLLAYALSFVNVGIYWNNHHHMLHATEHIDGSVLWANLYMLFWLSLAPWVIRWMDATDFAGLPTAAYGFVFGMAAIGFIWLQARIIAVNGRRSHVARAVGSDWKGKLSLGGYAIGTGVALAAPWVALAIYVAIAAVWFVPDPRIERSLID